MPFLQCILLKHSVEQVFDGLKLKTPTLFLPFFRFFLMYLINKDNTEYTGQETYVWDMYQRRCWDFFPAGDCFRKQYESELEGGGGG